jgi:hypothetical protein
MRGRMVLANPPSLLVARQQVWKYGSRTFDTMASRPFAVEYDFFLRESVMWCLQGILQDIRLSNGARSRSKSCKTSLINYYY